MPPANLPEWYNSLLLVHDPLLPLAVLSSAAPYWAIVQPVIMSALWATNGSEGYDWDLNGYMNVLYRYPLYTVHVHPSMFSMLITFGQKDKFSIPPWLHMHDVTAHHRYQYHNTNMTPLTKYELPAFWYLCIPTFIPYSNEPRCLEAYGKNW